MTVKQPRPALTAQSAGAQSPARTSVTTPQHRALSLLAEITEQSDGSVRPAHPRGLAKVLWPDSPAWQQRTRRYGANRNGAVGGTMPMKAEALL